MPAIPAMLGPLIEGYAVGAPAGVLRTDVGGGVPRYSLEWDRGKQPFQVSMRLTSEQMSVWTAFFHHVVHKGTLAFDMPLDSGFGLATHSVTIIPGTYSASRSGPHSTVSFTVDAESGAYGLTEAAALALIDSYNGYAPGTTPAIPREMSPVVEGYSFSGPGGGHRTDIAGGAPRTALAWDRGCQQFGVTLLLDAERFAVWTAFFHHVAKKGAVAFEMPLDSGFGVQTHLVNVVPGSYSATRRDGWRVVSFDVEAESTVYDMSAADAAALVDLYDAFGPGISDLLARIALFSNVETTAVLS